jgi:hypothetical protein
MGDRRQEFQVGVRTSLRSACGYLLLLMEEGKINAEGYTREQAWWSRDLKMIHQDFSFPEFVSLVLEGRQKIASLQAEVRSLQAEVHRLQKGEGSP